MDEDGVLPDSPDYDSRWQECVNDKADCGADCLREYHPTAGSFPGQEEPPEEDAKPTKTSVEEWDRGKLADLVVRMRKKTTLADKQKELQLRRSSLSQQDYVRYLNGVLYDRTASRLRANAEGAQLEEIASAIAYADQEARVFANYASTDVGSIDVASIVYLYHYAKRAADPSPYSYSERSSEPGEPLRPIFRYTPEMDLEHFGSLKSPDFLDLNTKELGNLVESVGEEVVRDAAGNVGQEIDELLDSIGEIEDLGDSIRVGFNPYVAAAVVMGAAIVGGTYAINRVFGDHDGDGQQNWIDKADDHDGWNDDEDCCPRDKTRHIMPETEGPGSVGFPYPLFRFAPGGISR